MHCSLQVGRQVDMMLDCFVSSAATACTLPVIALLFRSEAGLRQRLVAEDRRQWETCLPHTNMPCLPACLPPTDRHNLSSKNVIAPDRWCAKLLEQQENFGGFSQLNTQQRLIIGRPIAPCRRRRAFDLFFGVSTRLSASPALVEGPRPL